MSKALTRYTENPPTIISAGTAIVLLLVIAFMVWYFRKGRQTIASGQYKNTKTWAFTYNPDGSIATVTKQVNARVE